MSTLSVRRPLALLAVLAMVATLLFAVVGTASAADPVPAKTALFSACPDNANVPDGGFSDVPVGTFFNESVSCLAYYTVTTGVTPTTYEPGADVTRAQMALFLARGAAAAGVVLKASPPDAGFTDIAGLSVEAQTAINALADAGIVKGKTATTYEPTQPVLRQQMALFLTRFLGGAVTGPGGEALPATPQTSPFTDIGATTVEADLAINQAWDLGIAAGTTATTYAPLDNVNRGQMALFLTRTYAHANTRPAGVNIQANPMVIPMIIEGAIDSSVVDPDVLYSVTVRNADFTPTPNVHVDAFSFDAGKATDTPFKTDGTCDLDNDDLFVLFPGYSGDPDECKVSINDGVTNTNGNIVNEGDAVLPFFDIFAPFTMFYAWTGAIGAMFDVDTTTYSSVVIEGVPAPPALDWALLSVDSDTDTVAFGTKVTWTVQLMDGDDKPLAEAGVDVTFSDEWADDEIAETDSGTIVKVVETDASGKATYSVTEEMIDKDHEASHDVSAMIPGPPVVPVEDEYGTPDPSFEVWWSAVDPYADWVVLSTPTDYTVIAASPTTVAMPNSVTATVYDQYGDLYTGPGQVAFWSNRSEGLGGSPETPALTVHLIDGKATANYLWDIGSMSDMEWLYAGIVAGKLAQEIPFLWVKESAAGDMYYGPILWGDEDANELIVQSAGWVTSVALPPYESGFYLLTWKADDRYVVEGTSSTMAEFETFLDKAEHPWAIVDKYLDPADAGKTSWNVDDRPGG